MNSMYPGFTVLFLSFRTKKGLLDNKLSLLVNYLAAKLFTCPASKNASNFFFQYR